MHEYNHNHPSTKDYFTVAPSSQYYFTHSCYGYSTHLSYGETVISSYGDSAHSFYGYTVTRSYENSSPFFQQVSPTTITLLIMDWTFRTITLADEMTSSYLAVSPVESPDDEIPPTPLQWRLSKEQLRAILDVLRECRESQGRLPSSVPSPAPPLTPPTALAPEQPPAPALAPHPAPFPPAAPLPLATIFVPQAPVQAPVTSPLLRSLTSAHRQLPPPLRALLRVPLRLPTAHLQPQPLSPRRALLWVPPPLLPRYY